MNMQAVSSGHDPDTEQHPLQNDFSEEHTIEAAMPEKTPIKAVVPPSVNLSFGRKVVIMAVLCNMTLALTFSSTAYSSSVDSLKAHYNTSTEVILLGVALFVLGFAVGPLLFGPLAHLVGGRPVYVGTYICFTAFAFGASESTNVQTLIIMRFFMGVCGSSSLNNVPATIAEMVMPVSNGKYVIWYAISAFGGPAIGPVVASFVDHRVGFRWNLRMQAIFVAATTIACILFVPETSIPALKREKSKDSEGEEQSQKAFIIAMCKRSLIGPFAWLFFEPVVTFICIYLSLLYGIFYGFFEVVPYTFSGIRHWSEESTGLIYIAFLIGFISAFFVMRFLQIGYETRERAKLPPDNQQLSPESRIQQTLWNSILPPAGLFIFAWTAPFTQVHWIAPAIGMALFAQGTMVIFISLIPYLALYANSEAPLALAAGTFTRAAFGCIFPLFTIQMYNRLTVQGATSLLAGLSMLLVPMPWILKRYGKDLREKSKRSG